MLLSLLITTAEGCGGFDWDDVAFERAYAELESSLFGASRAYAAVAPLVGISVVTQFELGDGLRVRAAATGELARHWPEAQGLLPPEFGRAADRYCVLELERGLDAGEEPPDAPAELADAVTALRLATAAPVAAGPVLFERLDWRPFGIRAVLPIAATQPPGEPDRLDGFRGGLARELLGAAARSPTAIPRSPTRSTAGSCRSSRTSRSGPSSCAAPSRRCSARRGSCAPPCCSATSRSGGVRCTGRCVLSARVSRPRRRRRTRSAARSWRCSGDGDRPALVASLDELLLGLRAARLARTA